MVALALIMGVASPLWMRMIDPSVQQSLHPSNVTSAASQQKILVPQLFGLVR
jgi:hypothetical protein